MAEVAPFFGTRYNLDEVGGDLSNAVTPPYDVISPDMQDALYERHPLNFIRVDFGKDLPTDDEFNNKYTRASAAFEQWKQDGVLALDDRPAFTVYEQTYKMPDGSSRARRGVLGLVKLEDLGGGIHAHEKTFDAPKHDRFKLMRATQCNTSPIFCVYSDPEKKIDALLAEDLRKKPWAEFDEADQVHHRAWIVSAEKTCKALSKAFADKELFIADGHHRYETALLYRDQVRKQFKLTDGRQPFDWTFMYLANADDEGTTVFPFHRALARELDDGVDPDEFLGELGEWFRVFPKKIDLTRKGAAHRFAARVAEAGGRRSAFGAVLCGGRAALLKLKPGLRRRAILGRSLPRAIRDLDVTLLHDLIICRTWIGNPEIELGDEDVFYFRDPEQAFDLLRRRKACAVFLMNPPTMAQIMNVARSGRRMPQKSTFFYPKVGAGVVMREMKMA
ncbi:MAG: DUF1015 domain-containing protein [Candidatus Sumerlaeota bacterium]|nr:DUF1015 domain-containing protein [Candidatus Sumerlaeota bacterium]